MEINQSNINPPISEQVKILHNLYYGRTDAYGLEVNGNFICVHKPLTDKLIELHLNGEERVGSYPIDDAGNVRWAVTDIDEVDEYKNPNTRKAKENAVKVYAALVENKLAPYLESSKSKGFHIWLFFNEAIPAKIVRKVLKKILKDLGLAYEVFPKQDQVTSDNGVGNFVFLPLNGKLVKAGKNLFLDSNFEPYSDQWEYLKSIHFTKIENILALVQPDGAERESGSESQNFEINLDIPAYLNHYGVAFKIKKEGNRTLHNLEKCAFDGEHTVPDKAWQPAIIQGKNGKITYYCFHAHCSNKRWADIRMVISGNDSLAQFCKGYNQPTADKPTEDSNFKTVLTDRGLPKGLFEILDSPEEEEDPLIENLLYPGDKGFVVSTYKLGKTLFIMQMALCLSMGIPFLGLNIPKARRVLYIRFELKDARFRKRLNIMLPALGGKEKVQIIPLFHMVRGFDIKMEKDFAWLLSMIDQYEPEVLFLDPFYKLSACTDLKKDDGMGAIRRFDNLMGKFPQINISTAHHVRKQVSGIKDDSWDSAYGSVWNFADMDFEVRLTRKGNQKNTFQFSHISNDVTIDNFNFKRNPLTLLYELETKEDTRNRWNKDTAEVIEHIRTGGDTLNQKGNIRTWLNTKFGYTRREADEFLGFLLENKKIGWTGSKTKGHFCIQNESNDQVQEEMSYESA